MVFSCGRETGEGVIEAAENASSGVQGGFVFKNTFQKAKEGAPSGVRF
jgi:hypothetical protein